MLAVIDIGNTNLVLGIYQGLHKKCVMRLSACRSMTSDELGCDLVTFLTHHQIALSNIEAVCAVSVVPELDLMLEQACLDYLGLGVLWVRKQLAIKMPLAIEQPENLGNDRLLTAYAAWKEHQIGLIVVDTGTATKLNVVSAEGIYLGGAIAPGLEISRQALLASASNLKRIALQRPTSALGKSTEEQVRIGLIAGHAALVDGLVEGIKKELEQSFLVIATGGLAPFIKQASKTIQIINPDLILSGLCLLYQEYRSGTRDSFIINRPQCVVGHQEVTC